MSRQKDYCPLCGSDKERIAVRSRRGWRTIGAICFKCNRVNLYASTPQIVKAIREKRIPNARGNNVSKSRGSKTEGY